MSLAIHVRTWRLRSDDLKGRSHLQPNWWFRVRPRGSGEMLWLALPQTQYRSMIEYCFLKG